jgi:hypothetical protein
VLLRRLDFFKRGIHTNAKPFIGSWLTHDFLLQTIGRHLTL